jgi:transposase-like protein
MGRDKDRKTNHAEEAIRLAIKKCRDEQGLSVKELARRMGVTANTLTKRLNEGALPSKTLDDLAVAMGLTVSEMLSGGARPSDLVWDPASEASTILNKKLEPHESRASTGVGFFRIPNCPVLGESLMAKVHHNLFAAFEDKGKRLTDAYNSVGTGYLDEYYRTEGRYGGFDLTTLYMESDLERLVLCSYPYSGCASLVVPFLEGLRDEHVSRLGLRVGIIDDMKVPGEILYGLAGIESIVLIGDTFSLRRQWGTFRLTGVDGGAELAGDQRIVRSLLKLAGDLNPRRIIRRIEGFLRMAEKSLGMGEDNEKSRNVKFLDGWGWS